MKRKIDECNNFLNLINADCNSAVAVDYKDEVLQAECMVRMNTLSSLHLMQRRPLYALKLDGLRLLNEHS